MSLREKLRDLIRSCCDFLDPPKRRAQSPEPALKTKLTAFDSLGPIVTV
jgi:hypothetical protein